MTTARTTILLDADLLERVGRVAARGRTTKTAVITAALEAYLAEHEAAPAIAFVGIGRSSHGRLSLDGRRIVGREAGRRSGSGR
jgi:predicted transcriptional regulator